MANIYNTLEYNYIQFENHLINVIIDINEKVWFKAIDVANALGYLDSKDAIKKHIDNDNKIQLQHINRNSEIKGHPHTIYINEGGMYELIFSSKMPKAKKFTKWVTNEVLPSIRKFGFYKMKKVNETEIKELHDKLNFLEKEYDKLKKELKSDNFPDGGVVYIIDYSTDDEEIYRLGMSGDMALRKKIYDTHSLYKKDVVQITQTNCPIRLESCIRSMLYEYRFKNRKDFFVCNLKTIQKAFKACLDSFECIGQDGGFYHEEQINMAKKRKDMLQRKVDKLDGKL